MREASTRRKIERAALKLFAEEGADAVSVKRIACAAGVSQGALYTHYESKEDLAWSLFSENYSRIGTEIRQLVRHHRDVRAKMRAIVGHIYQRFEEDMPLWSYVFFARHTYVRKINPTMGNTFLVVRVVISEGIKKDEIPRQDLEVATSMVSGMILQVADNRILGRVKDNLTTLSDDVAESCLRALGYSAAPEMQRVAVAE